MRTVLIVDRSAVTCRTVSKQLNTVGFDTIQARSIDGAHVALTTRPIDLVILDPAAASSPSAPDAGVVTFLRELRRHRASYQAPVIFLTSSARESDRAAARAAGAVAFLTKPVSTRELLATVQQALASVAPLSAAARNGGAGNTRTWLPVGRHVGRPQRAAVGAPAARLFGHVQVAHRRDPRMAWAVAPLAGAADRVR